MPKNEKLYIVSVWEQGEYPKSDFGFITTKGFSAHMEDIRDIVMMFNALSEELRANAIHCMVDLYHEQLQVSMKDI